VHLSRTGWIITAVVIFVVLLVAWTLLQALGGSG
jgi:hypothetical protein